MKMKNEPFKIINDKTKQKELDLIFRTLNNHSLFFDSLRYQLGLNETQMDLHLRNIDNKFHELITLIGEYERSYCGVHRDKDEINKRFKFNKVAIK